MKRVVLFALTALLIVSSMTACGSKKNSDTEKGETYSRVLYADDSENTSEENNDENKDDEKKGETESKDSEEKKKDEKSESSKDSEEKKKDSESESKKESKTESKASSTASKNSSKASSSKASSSKTSSSKKTTTFIVDNTSKNSSSESSKSEGNTDTDSAAETDSWFDNESDTDQTDTETETETDTETDTELFFLEEDLSAPYNGAQIDLGDNFSFVNGLLGEYSNVLEEENPQNPDEVLKTYYFDGITVYTYGSADGSTEKVYKFEITDSSYETAKGASVGMSEEEIRKIYGVFDYGTVYVVEDKNVEFETAGGYVSKIIYTWDRYFAE